MIRTFRTRTGELSATAREKRLHSAVDPVTEAKRFVASSLPEVPATVVLIGAALGHGAAALKSARTDCRVVCLFLHEDCYANAVARGSENWHPGSGDLAQFLSSSIDELETVSLAVIEWAPATAAFPEEAEAARRLVKETVRTTHVKHGD
jgi:hypothetical protein